MAVSDARRSARLTWQELDERAQHKVLERLAKTRGARYRREFRELASVGFGYKQVRGEKLPQLCFAFLVLRKTKRATQLPKFIRAVVVHRGKKRHVDVPTDVEELGKAKPQVGANAASGIYVASQNHPQINATGALCCLVRVEGRSELFALSCHHVLTLSSKLPNGSVANDVLVADRAQHVPYGHLATYSPMKPNKPNQIDAALAVVNGDTHWVYNGASVATVEMGLVEPRGCGIFTPRGLEPATYIKTFYDVVLKYPTMSPVRIVAAYQFNASTLPGDSGSAVMDNDGTLYGMHFWGDPARSFSLAIPAGYLFQPAAFGNMQIELA